MFQFPSFAPDRLFDSAAGKWVLPHLGCPIRESPDRSQFAAPRGLSQLTTPFIAS
jgi:hypothetical protein